MWHQPTWPRWATQDRVPMACVLGCTGRDEAAATCPTGTGLGCQCSEGLVSTLAQGGRAWQEDKGMLTEEPEAPTVLMPQRLKASGVSRAHTSQH